MLLTKRRFIKTVLAGLTSVAIPFGILDVVARDKPVKKDIESEYPKPFVIGNDRKLAIEYDWEEIDRLVVIEARKRLHGLESINDNLL